MAYATGDRCPKCRARIEFRYVPELGRQLMFDDTTVPRGGDVLARWVEYPDPRTGALSARRLYKNDHMAPDEELIRLHAATCTAVSRNDHDR